MLAILKSEQERDEGKDVDLSASKIRQCNVSVNLSSVRTSTRTSISTVVPLTTFSVFTVQLFLEKSY